MALFQGGLQIPIKVFVSWSDETSMTMIKEKVESINYSCDMDNVDDSKQIIRDLREETMEEEEADCDRHQRASSKGII